MHAQMSDRQPMPAAYDPRAVEPAWSARWQEAGLFRADARSPKPKYSIAIPPPNVTGELHMGHALNGTLQDVWSRYRRMTGYEVLWLPGTDHAAIATQNVIERQLAQEGTTKEALGRAAFEARVEEWYISVGATIIDQYRELGASVDLTRLRFTMDPAYVRAVRTAFVHFWEKGWLYRGHRIVNWCPNNLSAISDLEVDWQEHRDTLYRIRYPVEGQGDVDDPGSPGRPPRGGTPPSRQDEVVIATVRPETMLADTGVAVHPDDERYRHLVGRHAILPLVGRRLPIVADAAVERGFGTGALKVTPGHDALDWEIGRRHGLPVINAMHPDGRMNVPDLPAYDGLPGVKARERVVRDLREQGYLVGTEEYVHQVAHCDRCGAVIEPLVSEQWFLRMDELAARALAASQGGVDDPGSPGRPPQGGTPPSGHAGRLRWHPERYERTYLDWLHGIRDWCVSRQLWLGHRIPVYTCPNGHTFASVEEPERCRRCGRGDLRQDPDVLDTWFSSALWPFATLGWPDQTEDLRTFYPTDLNVTAREIINLWVSRMVMTGLEFLGELPFQDVAITCVVQSADGRRMSKSKGNVVDPRGIIRQYGADALRGWAASVAMSSQDVRFDETRIEGFRRFANKLWNATRLVLGGLGEEPVATPAPDAELEVLDRWILSRLQDAADRAREGIEGYQFQDAVSALYDFAWHDYCDWYLEAVKPRLRDGDPAARAVLVHVLDVLLRLLHPFLPFVTEELWRRLPGERDFLEKTAWPEPDERFRDPEAEAASGRLVTLVEAVRSARQAAGAPPRGGRLRLEQALEPELAAIAAHLAGVELATELASPGISLAGIAARVEFPAAQPANGSVHRRQLQRLQADLDRAEGKLANPDFLARAPAAVVEKERARVAELRAAIARLP
jgi:valyl-tRNA synthetase